MTAALRLLLLMAYLPLAHFAGTRHSPTLAMFALGDLALLVLIEPLLRRRVSAWLALVAIAVALTVLARSAYALTPLLLVPSVFTAMIGGNDEFGHGAVSGRSRARRRGRVWPGAARNRRRCDTDAPGTPACATGIRPA